MSLILLILVILVFCGVGGDEGPGRSGGVDLIRAVGLLVAVLTLVWFTDWQPKN